MSISQLARSIRESATLKLNETAALLRDRGEPVIHLGGGEPKSKAPLDAIINMTSLANTGEVRYTPPDGIPALKKAIVRYTEEHYHRTVHADNVIVSGGAKQAVMCFLHAILDPKDEVIIPAPYWVSYPEMVKLAGGVPVIVKPEDGGFIPTLREIADACGQYTKAVVINSPNNPSGAMFPPELIAEIVAFCEKKHLYLLMDDIYNRLTFEGHTAPICYDYTDLDVENSRIVVINGVSKMYAMTGFRIGWAVASAPLIETMSIIQSQQTSGPAAPSQWAAVGALNGVQASVANLRMTLENNRNVMIERLQAFDGVSVVKPAGTFYCFPDFSAYEKNSHKLSQFLLDKVRVVTVPGSEFGFEGHLRLSYCGAVKDVTEGLERIKWALDPNSPNELYLGERKLVRDWL